MDLLQFAVPVRFGPVCAEVVTRIAGGATLLSGLGWWVNGDGRVEREEVSWLIVGVDGDADKVVEAVKEILRDGGESAIFYVVSGKPKLEWL